MGLFLESSDVVAEGERLPKTLSLKCLGEQCLNSSGVTCAAYEALLEADGSSGATDQPPLKDEASFAIYGQVCLGGEEEQLVGLRAEILKQGVEVMKIIALSGRYGDMPLIIQTPNQNLGIKTLASSD